MKSIHSHCYSSCQAICTKLNCSDAYDDGVMAGQTNSYGNVKRISILRFNRKPTPQRSIGLHKAYFSFSSIGNLVRYVRGFLFTKHKKEENRRKKNPNSHTFAHQPITHIISRLARTYILLHGILFYYIHIQILKAILFDIDFFSSLCSF